MSPSQKTVQSTGEWAQDCNGKAVRKIIPKPKMQ